jgi:hypothetical protein
VTIDVLASIATEDKLTGRNADNIATIVLKLLHHPLEMGSLNTGPAAWKVAGSSYLGAGKLCERMKEDIVDPDGKLESYRAGQHQASKVQEAVGEDGED